MSQIKRQLGITVLSPFIQNEGVEEILDNIVTRTGANAVAVNTSVAAPGAEGEGSFQPPDDAGASVRLFDRLLWGQHALWMRSGPGHEANPDFFRDSLYQPRPANDLTIAHGTIIADFIVAAKARGLKVYIQTGATQPPGLRDEDIPRLPDGSLPGKRMANVGSPASHAIRAWNRAWTRDIFARYPQIDGIRPDWPELPCYTLNEAFQDFGPHAAKFAAAHGFDFAAIRDGVARFYDYLHGGLTNDDLADFASPDRGKYSLVRLLTRFPHVADWFVLKAAMSVDLLREWDDAIKTFGGSGKELATNAFMPPFTQLTGFDFAGAAAFSASIAPKLYTMHWSLIVKFWGDVLLAENPGLDEEVLVHCLVNLLDLNEPNAGGDTIADYGYPEPDEMHPISNAAQARKIEQAMVAVGGRVPVTPIVHGYGPLDDFRRRFALVARSRADGVWINRYGYLDDPKLDAVGDLWRQGEA